MSLGKPAHLASLLPGLALCVGVTLVAMAAEYAEAHLFGRVWLESLVLAILLGSLIRTCFAPGPRYAKGIAFGAKFVLEVAVVLLGASVSAASIAAEGVPLLAGIVTVVALAIIGSYMVGRVVGLPRKMAILVACGNSICGNSAIAATAPVIEANSQDVAASIAFTAVLGVVVVLVLPLLCGVFDLSATQFGVFAGMTVYAVPQVLAATAPVAAASVQMGTLVKLVRVLMLGPVILILSLLGRRDSGARVSLRHLVPWFIVGFLLLMALRSLAWIPDAVLAPMHTLANLLTVVSMGALGLGVDLRSVSRAGARVTLAVTLSLLLLGGISLASIKLLGIA